MPVILEPGDEQSWLNAEIPTEEHLRLLRPYDNNKIGFHAISPLVNSVSNDNPQLIVPTPPADQFGNLTLFD